MSQPIKDDKMLIAKNLSRYYMVRQGMFKPKGIVKALDGVSFILEPGQTLAVVGESGCGKSTLARQVTMIEKPTGGSLYLDSHNVAQANRSILKQLRPLVQMVFQNPYASLNPRKQVGTMLAEPLVINTSLSAPERREKVQEMMARVGLRSEFFSRYPHMFSGGQRQRIAIARALMLNPKIVVADEPVSALDVSIQAQVLNLLMDLQEQTGVAYLFVSHNLSVVEHIAHDVMVMYLGKAVEHGSKTQIFAKPLHPYTRALLASTPQLKTADRQIRVQLQGELPSPLNPPSGCTFHKRCPYAVARCREEVPQLRSFNGQWAACHRVEEIS